MTDAKKLQIAEEEIKILRRLLDEKSEAMLIWEKRYYEAREEAGRYRNLWLELSNSL